MKKLFILALFGVALYFAIQGSFVMAGFVMLIISPVWVQMIGRTISMIKEKFTEIKNKIKEGSSTDKESVFDPFNPTENCIPNRYIWGDDDDIITDPAYRSLSCNIFHH